MIVGMAKNAKSYAIRYIKALSFVCRKWLYMVCMKMPAMFLAVLAGVVVSLEYSIAPFVILSGFALYFVLRGNAAAPAGVVLSNVIWAANLGGNGTTLTAINAVVIARCHFKVFTATLANLLNFVGAFTFCRSSGLPVVKARLAAKRALSWGWAAAVAARGWGHLSLLKTNPDSIFGRVNQDSRLSIVS